MSDVTTRQEYVKFLIWMPETKVLYWGKNQKRKKIEGEKIKHQMYWLILPIMFELVKEKDISRGNQRVQHKMVNH